MKLFENDESLTKILETLINGQVKKEIYDGSQLVDEDIHTIYAGCPDCLTDEYLMDL